MCRFMVFKGFEMSMADLLTRPSHSIVRQSYASLERTTSYVTPPELNGDGFGVGWYLDGEAFVEDPTPGVFTSIQPVWSSENLSQLARKIRSGLIFAHVRAASAPPVSETNCHPFVIGRYMFMHNGGIGNFRTLKRDLESFLSDRYYGVMKGTTDSEVLFALFMNQMEKTLPGFDPETTAAPWDVIVRALECVFEDLLDIVRTKVPAGQAEPSLLNVVVSDGETVVATRCTIARPEGGAAPGFAQGGASLYYASANTVDVGDGRFELVRTGRRENLALVSSEPLTSSLNDWVPVPSSRAVVITPEMDVLVRPLCVDGV